MINAMCFLTLHFDFYKNKKNREASPDSLEQFIINEPILIGVVLYKYHLDHWCLSQDWRHP